MKKTWVAAAALAIVAATGLAWGASAAEDDLQVVKRAVAVSVQDDGDGRPAKAAPAPRRDSRRPSWLKVRIVEEKHGKKEDRVSVTLPLALLGLLGKEATVDLQELGVPGLKHANRNVRIADVLENLEPGTLLVEVQDEDANVRVWVE